MYHTFQDRDLDIIREERSKVQVVILILFSGFEFVLKVQVCDRALRLCGRPSVEKDA